MPTPHISAAEGDFAPDVLMPGDPKRARRIAQTFFDDARLVTDVRGIEGWTGTWEGHPISVMASGMGQPSMSIYATELIRFYGVKRLVRVGTAGGMADEVQLGEVVIGSAAHTDSSMADFRIPGVRFSSVASFDLLERAVATARTKGIAHRVGTLFSSDTFYSDRPEQTRGLIDYHTLAVEMEAAALYGIAMREGVQALAVCNVSDHIIRGEEMDSDERERRFEPMVQVALGALFS
ncbi:purine-nucleoside phosphorylase [Microbacterium gorillae]|uniref:purine-nucleoside phosphorylase n=1 Tax=Microbacterium gorillae TaxID=1231063 RepID=UPI00058B6381|nr:purine-nucleoside phosphorylase [Microbacterium gorillae]